MTTTRRPRLTPHQKDVYRDLCRRSRLLNGHSVLGKDIGSRMALAHLVEKGYVRRHVEYGPRGGTILSYEPIGGLL